MTEMFDQTVAAISPKPTSIYGLKFFPDLQPIVDNNQDLPAFGWPTGPEVSECNLGVIQSIVDKVGNNCKAIMEIGVCRNPEKSMNMSHVLLEGKPNDAVYLGVDLEDKSFLNDTTKNIHTIQSNSHDQAKIRRKLDEIGIIKIDILMIDGWHSVNTCVNDWCYTDLLSDNGVVILHDTNAHPGCIALFHAIDETLFDKQRHCTDISDMGIAVFWHKKYQN